MARVSVLQLDTRFCRVPGDIGSAETFVEEPQIIRVPRASVNNIVTDQPHLIDLKPFLNALEGATGDIIVTSCGFLAPFQKQLQQATTKPVIASVLNALSDFDIKLGAEFSSILTFDADRLCDVHFPPPYRASDFRIVGLRPENPLRMRIEGDISGDFDLSDMTANVMDDFTAALTPSTQTVILECTNLPAYKPQMRTITKVRFVDILTAIELIAPNTIAPCFL